MVNFNVLSWVRVLIFTVPLLVSLTLTPHDGVDCDASYILIKQGLVNTCHLSIIWCKNGNVIGLYPSLGQKNGDPHL